jgi:molecular chaperone GrpE
MKDQEMNETEADLTDFHVVDKRKFLDLDKDDKNGISEEKPRYPSYVEELITKMAETERKFLEKKKQIDEEIGRTKARLEADFERKLELEKQKIVLPFLEVLDNLHRAVNSAAQTENVDNLLEGVHLIMSLFRSKLESIGVEPVPALDLPFNPNLQQAIGTIPVKDSNLDGVVLEEVQTGYFMNGQLLRPAQVRVGQEESSQ